MPNCRLLLVLSLLVSGFGRVHGQPDRHNADSVARLLWPVKQQGIVNDFGNLFSPQQVQRLERRIHSFTDSNGYGFAIVTLQAEPGVKGHLDSLGTIINSAWGVGSQEYDDGLTIVICASCREMRISTGLGTAQILPEPRTLRIVHESFLPPFKNGNYFEGVEAGLERLMAELRGKRPPPSF